MESELGSIVLQGEAVPIYTFYFHSAVDLCMFERAHKTELLLAQEVEA